MRNPARVKYMGERSMWTGGCRKLRGGGRVSEQAIDFSTEEFWRAEGRRKGRRAKGRRVGGRVQRNKEKGAVMNVNHHIKKDCLRVRRRRGSKWQ